MRDEKNATRPTGSGHEATCPATTGHNAVMPARPRRSAPALLAVILLLAAGCERSAQEPPPPTHTFEGPTMGTRYHVSAVGAAGAEDRRVRRCIDGVLARVDRHLSTYADDSELTAFNRSAAMGWIPVSDTLFAVVAAGQRVSVETDGAFDLTVAPLLRLWGYGAGAKSGKRAPDPELIHDATASVGYQWLELRSQPRRALRKGRQPLEIDVDAIAPGHAVDRISSCLRRAGLDRHLVEIGGEVRAGGRRADGRPWQVAIEAPLAGERRPYAGVELVDLAVATSGDYRAARVLANGRRVSHTLDPRTGEPVQHDLVSVTVVHPRATLADAYATALLVMGADEAYERAILLGLPVLLLERTDRPGDWRERSTPAFDAFRRGLD